MTSEPLDDRDPTSWQDEGDLRNELDEREAELAEKHNLKEPY